MTIMPLITVEICKVRLLFCQTVLCHYNQPRNIFQYYLCTSLVSTSVLVIIRCNQVQADLITTRLVVPVIMPIRLARLAVDSHSTIDRNTTVRLKVAVWLMKFTRFFVKNKTNQIDQGLSYLFFCWPCQKSFERTVRSCFYHESLV